MLLCRNTTCSGSVQIAYALSCADVAFGILIGPRNPRQAIGIDHASRNRRGLYLHSDWRHHHSRSLSHVIRISFASAVAAYSLTAMQRYQRFNVFWEVEDRQSKVFASDLMPLSLLMNSHGRVAAAPGWSRLRAERWHFCLHLLLGSLLSICVLSLLLVVLKRSALLELLDSFQPRLPLHCPFPAGCDFYTHSHDLSLPRSSANTLYALDQLAMTPTVLRYTCVVS